MRKPRAPTLQGQCFAGDRADGILGEVQPYVLVFEKPLILLDDGVARLGQDLNQGTLIQLIEHAHDWETADKLRDQPVFDQVLRLGLAQQLGVTMRTGRGLIRLRIRGLEAESLFADAASYHTLEPYKCAAADEQDVGGVDCGELLVRMLASALRRNVCNRAFQNLKLKRLLHAFAGDIAGDRRVFISLRPILSISSI